MPDYKNDIPGSARKGSIDTRSTDANGKQADQVKSHAERAAAKPREASRSGEVAGALKDETAR
jgi:hypothetical protein